MQVLHYEAFQVTFKTYDYGSGLHTTTVHLREYKNTA